jgi:hypothetical protein
MLGKHLKIPCRVQLRRIHVFKYAIAAALVVCLVSFGRTGASAATTGFENTVAATNPIAFYRLDAISGTSIIRRPAAFK